MKDRFIHGVLVLGLGHVFQIVLYFVLKSISKSAPIPDSFFVLLGFGVIQLLYVLPLLLIAVLTRRSKLAISLIIGAVLTFLLNVVVASILLSGGNLVP